MYFVLRKLISRICSTFTWCKTKIYTYVFLFYTYTYVIYTYTYVIKYITYMYVKEPSGKFHMTHK